jgi:hypothetical protein
LQGIHSQPPDQALVPPSTDAFSATMTLALVAEKASVLGGTSAWSGGWLWIPCNPLARAEGIDGPAEH